MTPSAARQIAYTPSALQWTEPHPGFYHAQVDSVLCATKQDMQNLREVLAVGAPSHQLARAFGEKIGDMEVDRQFLHLGAVNRAPQIVKRCVNQAVKFGPEACEKCDGATGYALRVEVSPDLPGKDVWVTVGSPVFVFSFRDADGPQKTDMLVAAKMPRAWDVDMERRLHVPRIRVVVRF